MSGETVFSHENSAHTVGPAHAAPAEQQAWGIAGDARKVRRTVSLALDDSMRIVPAQFSVKLGETVRLRAINHGGVLHEVVLGTEEELAAHAELMKRFPDMAHDEAHMAHVPPGQSRDIVWHFNRPGMFGYACLIPGHFEAGMRGTVRVLTR